MQTFCRMVVQLYTLVHLHPGTTVVIMPCMPEPQIGEWACLAAVEALIVHRL